VLQRIANASWMNEHKRVWRVAVLVLLLVAIAGPWAFDLILVPSEYSCSAPAYRLEGDYCGIPMSGIWILLALVGPLPSLVAALFTGTTAALDRASWFVLLGLLPLLPLITTPIMVLRGGRRYLLVYHVGALCLGVGWGLFVGMSGQARLSWVLWGVWLYVGSAAAALILEGTMLIGNRRPGQELA
jgi:hypothetical protein